MIDTHAATELKLFIDNDADLYRRQTTSILKNLATKKARGAYKHDLAVKLFGYLVEAGAKKYVKEFGTPDHPWHKMFDVPTRRAVAESLTKSFETEYALGNYDNLLPKKYKAEGTPAGKRLKSAAGRFDREIKSSSSHARKASSSKSTKWKIPGSLKVVWSVPNSAWFVLWPGHGPIKDQQVLKIAGTEDMHEWLRSTYGNAYGLAGRATAHVGHARKKSGAQLDREISHALSSRGTR